MHVPPVHVSCVRWVRGAQLRVRDGRGYAAWRGASGVLRLRGRSCEERLRLGASEAGSDGPAAAALVEHRAAACATLLASRRMSSAECCVESAGGDATAFVVRILACAGSPAEAARTACPVHCFSGVLLLLMPLNRTWQPGCCMYVAVCMVRFGSPSLAMIVQGGAVCAPTPCQLCTMRARQLVSVPRWQSMQSVPCCALCCVLVRALAHAPASCTCTGCVHRY